MMRRSFFQVVAAALLPQPVLAGGKPLPAKSAAVAGSLPVQAAGRPPDWLLAWREIPKIELFPGDLECHDDERQREIAARVMRHIDAGLPLTFRYCGGSAPGTVRTVQPILLFYQDYFSYYPPSEEPGVRTEFRESPFYLLGWCQTRQAARYFRLDRMEPSEPSPAMTSR